MPFLTPRAVKWIIASVFLVATARLAWFVDRYAVNLIFWDQWDFLHGLFVGEDWWTLFRWQHGPQRQGLGNLITAALYSATGWNARADAAAAAVLMLLAALAGLWLVRRLCGQLRPWDAVVPLLFLTTSSAETYAAATNLAHGPLSALFLVALALALTVQSHSVRCALIVGVNALAVNTGFTLLLGPVTPALLLLFASAPTLRPSARVTYAAGAAASIGAMALVLKGLVFHSATSCFQFPHPRPLEYLPFAGSLLTHALGLYAGDDVTPSALASIVAIVVVALWAYATFRLIRSRGDSMLWNVAGLLLTFTVLFTIVTTVGRVCLGLYAASATRYIPYVLPGLLAVYLLPRSGEATRIRTTVLALFLAGVTAREVAAARNDAEASHHATHKRLWADCYLARHVVAECDAETGGPIYPAAEATGLQEKLDWLEERRYSLFQERTRLRFGPVARAERSRDRPSRR
jgi:hypothetical protein